MKWFIVIVILFASQKVFSQGLADIFLNLPDGYCGTTKVQRDSLIKNFIGRGTSESQGVGIQKHYLSTYEPQNGYLTINGAYEGFTTMTFWNLSTGGKLIGIVSGSCGPACDCHLTFLLLSTGVYQEVKVEDIIPKLSFSDFMDEAKMKGDTVDVDLQKSIFNNYPLMYGLPSKGKNITVRSQYHEFGMDDKFKAYSRGTKMRLTWQDGKFVKGDHFD